MKTLNPFWKLSLAVLVDRTTKYRLKYVQHVVKLWRTWERVKGEKLTKEARREISADFKAGIAKAVKEKDTSDLEEMFRSAVND